MFEPKNEIENVSSFIIDSKDNLLLLDEALEKLPNDLSIETVETVDKKGDLLIYQDFGLRTLYVLNSQTNQVIFNAYNSVGKYSFSKLDLDDLVFVQKRLEGKKTFNIFDFRSKEFTEIANKIDFAHGKGEILIHWNRIQNSISRVSISGELIWTYQFEGYFMQNNSEVTINFGRSFGIINKLFWIGNTKGELFGLDPDSGIIKKTISIEETDDSNYFLNISEIGYIPNGERMLFLRDSNTLCKLHPNYYSAINFNEHNLIRRYYDISQEFANIGIENVNSTPFISDNNLLFGDYERGKLGIFDTNQKRLLWTYNLNIPREKGCIIRDMKYQANKWYVHDYKNTLHVLEKLS